MQLSDEQRSFIIEAFAAGLTIIKVVKEVQEFFPDMEIEKEKLYQRCQKIKASHAAEIESLADELKREGQQNIAELYLSPLWRVRYFRRLLREADKEDINLQVKLLKEIRAESKLMSPRRVLVSAGAGSKNGQGDVVGENGNPLVAPDTLFKNRKKKSNEPAPAPAPAQTPKTPPEKPDTATEPEPPPEEPDTATEPEQTDFSGRPIKNPSKHPFTYG